MATITEYFKAGKSIGIHANGEKKKVKTDIEVKVEEAEVVDVSTLELELLRRFDLDSKFGPCTGISRLERWERASKYGFDPPIEVRDIVLLHSNETKYTESVWFGMKI